MKMRLRKKKNKKKKREYPSKPYHTFSQAINYIYKKILTNL